MVLRVLRPLAKLPTAVVVVAVVPELKEMMVILRQLVQHRPVLVAHMAAVAAPLAAAVVLKTVPLVPLELFGVQVVHSHPHLLQINNFLKE
jgi:hypothetical protein